MDGNTNINKTGDFFNNPANVPNIQNGAAYGATQSTNTPLPVTQTEINDLNSLTPTTYGFNVPAGNGQTIYVNTLQFSTPLSTSQLGTNYIIDTSGLSNSFIVNTPQTAVLVGSDDSFTLTNGVTADVSNAFITLPANASATVYGLNNTATGSTGSVLTDDLPDQSSTVETWNPSSAIASEMKSYLGWNGTGANTQNVIDFNPGQGERVTYSDGTPGTEYDIETQSYANLPAGVTSVKTYSNAQGIDGSSATTGAYGGSQWSVLDPHTLAMGNLTQESLDFSGATPFTGQATTSELTYTSGVFKTTQFDTLGQAWQQINDTIDPLGQLTQINVIDNNGYYYNATYDSWGNVVGTNYYTGGNLLEAQTGSGIAPADPYQVITGAVAPTSITDIAGFDFTNSGTLTNISVANAAVGSLSQSSDVVAIRAADKGLMQAYALANQTTNMHSSVYEGGKWSGTTLTWSLATGAGTAAAPFSSYMSTAYLGLVQQAFAAWASNSGLHFVQVSDSAASDLRLGWGNFNTTTSGVLGYTLGTANAGVLQADDIIRLEDPSQLALAANASGALTYAGTNATLLQSLEHEIGHALGLADNSDPNSIEYYQTTGSNPVIDATDSSGIQKLYSSAVSSVSFGTAGGQTLTGGSGYEIYNFAKGDGADSIVNGASTNTGPSGELDFSAGISSNNLSFSESGNDLVINMIGSADKVSIKNWFSNTWSQLQAIQAGDGNRFTVGANNTLVSENYGPGTSQVMTFNPSSGIVTEIDNYSGLNGTGAKTSVASQLVNTGSGSQLRIFTGLATGIFSEYQNFSGANGSGSITGNVINYTAGGSQAQSFTNLPSGVVEEDMNYTGSNGTGNLTGNIAYDMATGNDATQAFSNSTFNVTSNTTVTLNGSGNTVNAGGSDTVSVASAGGSGNTTSVTGNGTTIIERGTNDTLVSTGATDNLILLNINDSAVSQGSGTNISLLANSDVGTLAGANDTATIQGTGDTITATGNGASFDLRGSANTGNLQGASETAYDNGANNNFNATNASIQFGTNGVTGNINGNGNSIGISTNGDTLYISNTSSGNQSNVSGSNSTIVDSGASDSDYSSGSTDNVILYGNNDTATAVGTGTNLSLLGNNETGTLAGSNDTATIQGTGDTITATGNGAGFDLRGSSNTGNLQGASETAYDNGANNSFNATNATIQFGTNGLSGSVNGSGNQIIVSTSNDTLSISNGSAHNVITIAGNNNLVTDDGAHDTIVFSGTGDLLKLDTASGFSGTLAGFAQGESIDLSDFRFSGTPTISKVTGNGASGTATTLTISDGAQIATLALLNQYASQYAVNASAYSLASDHNGANPGTLLQLAAAH